MAESSGTKTGALFIGALLFGIAAGLLTWFYLGVQEKRIAAKYAGEDEEMVAVVVANQDLSKGTRLNKALLATRPIPAKFVHANAINPGQIDAFVGRFIVEDLSRGKPILTNFLNETFPVDFSDLVEKGRRAMTVQVDEVNSISGLLRPGNYVDIFVNIPVKVSNFKPEGAGLQLPEGLTDVALQAAGMSDELGAAAEQVAGLVGGETNKPQDVIIPVLQDVKVLSTGRETYDENLDGLSYPQRRSDLNFTSITLDVSPDQAALLAIAEDKGDLIATLRNRKDRGGADFTGLTAFDLINNANKMKEEAALRKAAEAAGATIDENGNWVSADGTVTNKDDIVISENGTVTTKGGQILGASGISVNENGEYVDENGNVINPDDIIVNADGSITTKQALMEAAGYTLNENGEYVDKDGNVVNPDDIKVLANGTIIGKDGKVISGPNVKINKHGCIIGEDNTVMTAEGKVLKGVFVDENDNVIGPDGKIITDCNLTVAADGTVRDKDGNIISGITGSSLPPGYGEDSELNLEDLLEASLPEFYNMIIGGASEDGVAKSKVVPISPLAQQALDALAEESK